jgi:hypothetical protein
MNVTQVFIVIFYLVVYVSLDRLLQSLYSGENRAPTAIALFQLYTTSSRPFAPTAIANQVAETHHTSLMQCILSPSLSVTTLPKRTIWANVTSLLIIRILSKNLDSIYSTISTPESIRVIASQLSRERLLYFIEAASQVVNDGFTNGTARSIFSEDNQHQHRYLQEASIQGD